MKTIKLKQAGVVLTLLVFAQTVYPISRVGDGKSVSSTELGFVTPVPDRYAQTRIYKDGTLNIFYSGFSPAEGFKEQPLYFHPLQSIYPQMIGKTKPDSEEFLQNLGTLVELQDSCVLAYRIESKSLIYTVFQWAPQKGLVVMGPKDQVTKQSLQFVESELKLLPGACEWN